MLPQYLDQLSHERQEVFKKLNGIGITFVHHPYKPLGKLIETGFLPLFHLDDLAANKAYTIGRRDTWRDYVDLFFLLKWKLYFFKQKRRT